MFGCAVRCVTPAGFCWMTRWRVCRGVGSPPGESAGGQRPARDITCPQAAAKLLPTPGCGAIPRRHGERARALALAQVSAQGVSVQRCVDVCTEGVFLGSGQRGSCRRLFGHEKQLLAAPPGWCWELSGAVGPGSRKARLEGACGFRLLRLRSVAGRQEEDDLFAFCFSIRARSTEKGWAGNPPRNLDRVCAEGAQRPLSRQPS